MAWEFNESRTGALSHPAQEHCRVRVPSLWHAVHGLDAPLLPSNARACTPHALPATVPDGAMRCAEVDASRSGVVLCRGYERVKVQQPWRTYQRMPLQDLAVVVGRPFSYTLPADALLDPIRDGRLGVPPQLSAAELVLAVEHGADWLHFDVASRRLHGTPPSSGTWQINVTATDPGMDVSLEAWHGKDRIEHKVPLTATDVFLLHVQDVAPDSSEDYWTRSHATSTSIQDRMHG